MEIDCYRFKSQNKKTRTPCTILGIIVIFVEVFFVISSFSLKERLIKANNISIEMFYYRELSFFLFSIITGIGLIFRKKWAAILVLLPGILFCKDVIRYEYASGTMNRYFWNYIIVMIIVTILTPSFFIFFSWKDMVWFRCRNKEIINGKYRDGHEQKDKETLMNSTSEGKNEDSPEN